VSSPQPPAELLAVPNVSEGRDAATIDAIARAFEPAQVLDVSSDVDHHRTVYTVRGTAGALAECVARAAEVAVERIDLRTHTGAHPRVGAVDVAPIVHLDDAHRGAAIAEAIVLAELIGSLGVPVYLYGELAGGRTRAELRRGITAHAPDYGPAGRHPTAGATLVAARPPLIAFNVEIDAGLDTAREIAAAVRTELPGVRAIGLRLERQQITQVSTNIEHGASPADVVDAVARRARVSAAELVAPAPRRAFAGFPADVLLKGAERAIL
jgi:glutamate formiminotransferase / 5-formyltetrahydrofolate cyclo-ligase